MAQPNPSIPVKVLIEAEEVMRQIRQLSVNEPVPPKLWVQLSAVSAAMTFYKDNVLAQQRIEVRQ